MYAMDMRQYDPAIARWVAQDPVVHFEYSPYSAFNNSPVFWADPSGADSDVFGRTTNINGKAISVTDRGDIGEASEEKNQRSDRGDQQEPKNKKQERQLTQEQKKKIEEYVDDLKFEQDLNNLGLEVVNYDNRWVALGHMFEFSMPTARFPRLFSIFSKSFKVASNKFDYFFGRVLTGNEHNIARSAQNLKDLTSLGIKTESQLIQVFENAFKNGTVVSSKTTQYGTTITKAVDVGGKGRLNVSFFYNGGSMNSTPTVSTIIPKVFN
jgi:hypothetical protein